MTCRLGPGFAGDHRLGILTPTPTPNLTLTLTLTLTGLGLLEIIDEESDVAESLWLGVAVVDLGGRARVGVGVSVQVGLAP